LSRLLPLRLKLRTEHEQPCRARARGKKKEQGSAAVHDRMHIALLFHAHRQVSPHRRAWSVMPRSPPPRHFVSAGRYPNIQWSVRAPAHDEAGSTDRLSDPLDLGGAAGSPWCSRPGAVGTTINSGWPLVVTRASTRPLHRARVKVSVPLVLVDRFLLDMAQVITSSGQICKQNSSLVVEWGLIRPVGKSRAIRRPHTPQLLVLRIDRCLN
jgi:hypothetical protein